MKDKGQNVLLNIGCYTHFRFQGSVHVYKEEEDQPEVSHHKLRFFKYGPPFKTALT